MLPLLAASYLALATTQVAAPAEPPAILQVYREPLKAGVRAEYDRIESDTATQCAQLRCPHAYLGLESLTGPKEVWWLNGYDSDADRKQVADAWAASTEVLALLGRNAKRKAALVGKAIESIARYRPDLSDGERWRLGRGTVPRDLVRHGHAGARRDGLRDGRSHAVRHRYRPDPAKRRTPWPRAPKRACSRCARRGVMPTRPGSLPIPSSGVTPIAGRSPARGPTRSPSTARSRVPTSWRSAPRTIEEPIP